MKSLIRNSALAAICAAALAGGGFAWAQSGSFAGNDRDELTGYPCLTPFCETVVLPGTDCVCRKDNPGATRLSEVRLTCTTDMGRRQCPVEPGYGR